MAYEVNPFQITAFQVGAFQFGAFQQEVPVLTGGSTSQDDYREAIRLYDEKEARERAEGEQRDLEQKRLIQQKKASAFQRIRTQAAQQKAQLLAVMEAEQQQLRKRIQDEEEAFIFINSSIF